MNNIWWLTKRNWSTLKKISNNDGFITIREAQNKVIYKNSKSILKQ